MTGATAYGNGASNTFMFHPRTAVFDQPITVNLSSLKTVTSITDNKPDKTDLAQYYISETK